jgi:hypothetical protein
VKSEARAQSAGKQKRRTIADRRRAFVQEWQTRLGYDTYVHSLVELEHLFELEEFARRPEVQTRLARVEKQGTIERARLILRLVDDAREKHASMCTHCHSRRAAPRIAGDILRELVERGHAPTGASDEWCERVFRFTIAAIQPHDGGLKHGLKNGEMSGAEARIRLLAAFGVDVPSIADHAAALDALKKRLRRAALQATKRRTVSEDTAHRTVIWVSRKTSREISSRARH